MTWRMTSLADHAWVDLIDLPVAEWLWLDLVGEGVHRETTLPALGAPGLTHAWGWAPDCFARLRVDSTLPNGFTGSVLTRGDDAPGIVVHLDSTEGVPWAAGDRTIGLSRASRQLVGQALRMHVARYVLDGESKAIQFLSLGARSYHSD